MRPLPDDATLSEAIARRGRSTISTVEPHRAQVERRVAEGVGGIAIHAAPCRNHGYRGSYSASGGCLPAFVRTLFSCEQWCNSRLIHFCLKTK
jgi:hypothetical protein